MHGTEVELLELAEERGRGRRPRHRHRDLAVETVRLGIVHHADLHGGRAAVMGDALRLEEVPHPPGFHTAETHVRSRHRRHRPREAPAVAVEHGQGPEILRLEVHPRLDHLPHRVDPGPAMRVHDSLGPARGARGVVDGNGLFLVFQHRLHRLRAARGEKVLVGIAGGARVVYAHHGEATQIERLHRGLELVVHEQEGRARVLEDVADLVGGEPDVDGDENAAGQGDAVVRLEHGRGIGADEGNPIVLLESRRAEGGGEAVHTLLELPVAVAPAPVDDRGLVREHVGIALEEADRRQLRPVHVVMLHERNPPIGLRGRPGRRARALA